MKRKLIIENKSNNIFIKFWNFCWNIYYDNQEFWNYIIFGLLTTFVSLFVYFLCTNTFLDSKNEIELQIANIISWVFAVAFAYITNRKYVFNSKNSNILKEVTKFVGSRIFSLLVDMLCMYIVVSLLLLSDIIGKIISQILITITNYILSKLLVFKKEK